VCSDGDGEREIVTPAHTACERACLRPAWCGRRHFHKADCLPILSLFNKASVCDVQQNRGAVMFHFLHLAGAGARFTYLKHSNFESLSPSFFGIVSYDIFNAQIVSQTGQSALQQGLTEMSGSLIQIVESEKSNTW
jgi:hypothetical protein